MKVKLPSGGELELYLSEQGRWGRRAKGLKDFSPLFKALDLMDEIMPENPGPAHGNPERALVRAVAEALGGEAILPQLPEPEPGTVY